MAEEKNLSGNNNWSRALVMIVALILFSVIIIVALVRDRIVNQMFKSVTITGQGRVSYVPDIAIITLGVQIDKVSKPADALNQLNLKIDSIIKAVQAAGIEPENIQAQNYYLYPQYDYKDNVSTVSGYNANEQLVIKVKKYDKEASRLNRVIAAASSAGANQINSLAFDSSTINDLKQQARLKAIADAKDKSISLAKAAGVELKDITGWYENLISPNPAYIADYGKGGLGAGGAMPTTQVPSGDREVVLEIGVTYNIK
ncbi:MAG: SIMPL domain-containing protein [Patescibacteria group bacterium]